MQFLNQMLVTSRPLGWPIFMVSYLGGVFVTGKYFSLQQIITLVSVGPILSFLVYSFNDIYDYESDKINERKKFKIMGGVLNAEYWQPFRFISIILSLALLALPLIFGNLLGAFLVLLGLFVGVGYSVPPIRLKTRLGGDIVSCCLGFFALFMLGMSENLSINNLVYSLKYSIFSAFMVAVWSLLFLGLDYKSDKKADHLTSAHKFTHKQVMSLAGTGYLLIAFGISWLFQLSIVAVILLPCSLIIFLGLRYQSSKYNIFTAVSVTLLSVIAYSSLYIPLLMK